MDVTGFNMKKIISFSALLLLSAAIGTLFFAFQEAPKTGTAIGDAAPEIKIGGVDGKFITLSSLKGKMVLVDFWASWSGPCRTENPNLVLAYNKYKNAKFKNATGFEIYSISLDNQKEAWIKAIGKDNLYWPNHVSELMYWNDKTTKVFGINTLPSNILIDGNGIILAKNLTGRVPDSEGKPTQVSKIEAELIKHLKQ